MKNEWVFKAALATIITVGSILYMTAIALLAIKILQVLV